MEGHAQAFASHYLARLDDLPRGTLDSYNAAIEVHQGEVHAGERIEQSDLFLNDEVGPLPLESLVRPHFDDDDDIARLDLGDAVALPVELELLATGGTLVDFDLDDFVVLLDLLALAVLAPFCNIDVFSLPAAIIAGTCGLRVHSWAHLSEHGPHAAALTGCALLDGRGIASSDSIAVRTDALPVDLDFDGGSVVDVGQGDWNFLYNWLYTHFLSLLWPSASSHEHVEDVVHASGASPASSVLESLQPVLVVGLPLLLVGEDVVGSLDLFELKISGVSDLENFSLLSRGLLLCRGGA